MTVRPDTEVENWKPMTLPDTVQLDRAAVRSAGAESLTVLVAVPVRARRAFEQGEMPSD